MDIRASSGKLHTRGMAGQARAGDVVQVQIDMQVHAGWLVRTAVDEAEGWNEAGYCWQRQESAMGQVREHVVVC